MALFELWSTKVRIFWFLEFRLLTWTLVLTITIKLDDEILTSNKPKHGNLAIIPIIQVLLGVVLAQQLLADPGGQVRVIFDISSRFTSVLRHRCQGSLTFNT